MKECIYCGNTFITDAALIFHQKTTKACLRIQEQKGITPEKISFPCSFCKKHLTTKPRLASHILICKKKIAKDAYDNAHKADTDIEDRIDKIAFELRNHKEEIEYELKIKDKKFTEELKRKDEKINELEKKIIQLTHIKSTSNSNSHNKIKHVNSHNITNNITIQEVMTPERVEDFFKKHYNLETLLGGQKALAQFICEKFILSQETPVYQCTDRSRQKFMMNQNGEQVEDPNCENIVRLTAPGMPHVKDVYEDALFSEPTEKEDSIQEKYRSVISLDKERTQFKNEMSKIVPSDDSSSSKQDNWKIIFQTLRDNVLPYETKQSLVESDPIKKPDVCGINRSKLIAYRDRYRKDGVIKGPPSIMDNDMYKEEYLEFLKS
jgi:hypothetical protein